MFTIQIYSVIHELPCSEHRHTDQFGCRCTQSTAFTSKVAMFEYRTTEGTRTATPAQEGAVMIQVIRRQGTTNRLVHRPYVGANKEHVSQARIPCYFLDSAARAAVWDSIVDQTWSTIEHYEYIKPSLVKPKQSSWLFLWLAEQNTSVLTVAHNTPG